MNLDADRLVPKAQYWLRWAEEHGVRYDDAGKSFDDVARDDHREPMTPRCEGTASAQRIRQR